MTDNKFHISIKCSTLSDNSLEQVVEQCFDVGFTATDDGRIDIVSEYESGRYDEKQSEGKYSRQTVIDEITEDRVGSITFWYGKYPITLDCFLDTKASLDVPNFIFEVDRYVFRENNNSIPPERYVDTFVNLTKSIVSMMDVVFAKGACGLEVSLPSKRPITNRLEHLPWLTVFSERAVNELGGYERVLATPAWQVEKLNSGHVLLVRSDNPFYPTETPTTSINSYLLNRKI